jgi:hypothetical protein
MKLFVLTLSLLLMAGSGFAQPNEANTDTLYVSGKAVVFFGPSQAEYLSLTDQEKDAIDEALYDFYHYRLKVLPYLKANTIKEFSTAKLKIQIRLNATENIIFHRETFDDVVGLIMTDGQQQPSIFLGPATDAELISMFEAFFGLY